MQLLTVVVGVVVVEVETKQAHETDDITHLLFFCVAAENEKL
jgi:hypothetical protein